jgi:hypothetical protein
MANLMDGKRNTTGIGTALLSDPEDRHATEGTLRVLTIDEFTHNR